MLPLPPRQPRGLLARPPPVTARPPLHSAVSAPVQQDAISEPAISVPRTISATSGQVRNAEDTQLLSRSPDPSLSSSPARPGSYSHQPRSPGRGDQLLNHFKDEIRIIRSKKELCSECKAIPFASCLPSRYTDSSPRTGRAAVHITELKHILKMKDSCPFCGLLLRCAQKPENDLFRPDHIRKPLSCSQKLGDIPSFDAWVRRYSRVKRIMGGEEAWPFGYTADPKEAAQAMREAEALFESAEERDMHAGRLDELLSSTAGLADALDAATFGVDLVGVLNPEIAARGGRVLEGTRMLSHQMAAIFRKQRSPLPCCFVIRAYRADEGKGCAVSVRVFAHGRGARASLGEVCHFSLRFEGARTLRRAGTQLWYGRRLGPTVDVEFFRTCLDACEELHRDVCGRFRWSSQSRALRRHAGFAFRLVEVEQMCVIETDFEKIILPQWRRPYVTLSYTWGSSDRDDLVVLTSGNLTFLTKPGALNVQGIPQTVRDAMEVVRRMGLRYLWVDRLCIPQRKESQAEHPDNPANIANMGRIYGEALFTIVAGSSQDMDQGLLGMQPGRSVSGQIVGEIGPGVNLFLPTEMPQNLDTWESRAWTFQEKLLSRRMLVFSGGFAVWRCRCAVWREDVNALDGDIAALSFPWPDFHEVHHADSMTESERFGLRETMHDGSTRLFRGSAFHQYVQCVEDFSRRDISDPRLVLDACEGIVRVLGSPKLLNSPFSYGLPTRFIDAALLWQSRKKIRRRTFQTRGTQATIPGILPSWSWAGWEASEETSDARKSLQVHKGSKGASVAFASPFDVRVDDVGILMSLSALSEERIRPCAHILSTGTGITASMDSQPELREIGLLGESWMRAREHQQETANGEVFRDWEYRKAAIVRNLPFHQLTERQLVISTQITSLFLGGDCFRVRRITEGGGKAYCRESLDSTNPLGPGVIEKEEQNGQKVTVLQERWILDAESSERVGTATCSDDQMVIGRTATVVKAIVLSETQYLGNETRADVLGYPLYNILLVEFKPGGFAERIGLGKVYKTAWKRTQPSQQTIILG